ncbi:MAG: [protein-PII] uridylyltransferase, partial [Alphaproteobacteria bacterium]
MADAVLVDLNGAPDGASPAVPPSAAGSGRTMHGIHDVDAILDGDAFIARLDGIAADLKEGAGVEPPTRARLLDLFRQALDSGRGEIRRRFESGQASGRDTVTATSWLMDQLLHYLGDFARDHAYPTANPTTGEQLCLVAAGGYGRGELAPCSDIDLMVLMPAKTTPRSEQVIEFILYMLWDLGLKVGYTTHAIDGILRLAVSDMNVRTAVLETRFIWGARRLFLELRRRFYAEVVAGREREFVRAKLAERDQRHKRLGDSRYVMEPNLKDGKGGMRDLQTLYWIAKYLFRIERPGDLVFHGILEPREAQQFARAQNLFWTIRCHLHYLTGRAEDRLTFDLQPDLARRMAYRGHAGANRVERFLKHYYITAKTVGDLTRIFCAALEAQYVPRRGSRRRLKAETTGLPEGFRLADGWLAVESGAVFEADPVNLIRLFHLAHEDELDIHPRTLRLVTRRLRLITNRLRRDKTANALFLHMLTSRSQPDVPLRRMSEAGVLARFVPDFGRIVAHPQFDMYHVYTVDEHTLRALALVAGIESGALAHDHPVSAREIHNLSSRRALYVAMFLHDLGKGQGGDHERRGAEIARRLCPRLGLNAEETETVAWLVAHQAVMSDIAFHRDITAAETVRDFAHEVQSPERLRLLLVLTVADIRAVGPKVWNGWKASLLRELYQGAMETLTGEAPVDGAGGAGVGGGGRSEAVPAAAVAALRQALADFSDSAFAAHVEKTPDAYWRTVDTAMHARHARLMRGADRAGRTADVQVRFDRERGATEVTVFCADRPGLFARIAEAMHRARANVLDARVFTTKDGRALDTLWVMEDSGAPLRSGHRLAEVRRLVLQALSEEPDAPPLAPPDGGRAGGDRARGASGDGASGHRASGERRFVPERTRVFRVPPRVLIDNETSVTHTLIEINGRDRPGVLRDIARAMHELGLRIAAARIATYGERIVDVFYVRDAFGHRLTHRTRLDDIRHGLIVAVEGQSGEPGEANARAVEAA